MHYRYTAGCISYYDGEKERKEINTKERIDEQC
jgi:hypothetical protein